MAGRMLEIKVKPSYQTYTFAVIINDELSYVETTHFIQAHALDLLRQHVELGDISVREFPPPDVGERAEEDDMSFP